MDIGRVFQTAGGKSDSILPLTKWGMTWSCWLNITNDHLDHENVKSGSFSFSQHIHYL